MKNILTILIQLLFSHRFKFRDSNNWNKVDPQTREQLRYQRQADGEFWYDDDEEKKKRNFDRENRFEPIIGCSTLIG